MATVALRRPSPGKNPPPQKRGRGRPRKHPVAASAKTSQTKNRTAVSDEDLIGEARGGDGRVLSRSDNNPPIATVSVSSQQLKSYVSRIEKMEEEKAAVAEQIRETYAEAKDKGFDTKIIRRVIARRKRDADEIAHEDAVFEVYLHALGMITRSTVVHH